VTTTQLPQKAHFDSSAKGRWYCHSPLAHTSKSIEVRDRSPPANESGWWASQLGRQSLRDGSASQRPAPGDLQQQYGLGVHIEITTERLRLRPLTEADVDPLLAILGDAETMRWYPQPYSRDGVVEWIARNMNGYVRDGFGLLAIEDRKTGEFLGDCGPTIQDVEGEPHIELGWHVRRDRWGQGIATQAGAACRDWSWTNLNVDHLISLIRNENRQSCRVAEKIGMSVWRDTNRAGLSHFVYRINRPTL
jgi:RimJ/RimL family protein N-acetyltransferase